MQHGEREGSSKFSVDWIVARVSSAGNLLDFVAVEVQTIDTTGNYQKQFWDVAAKHAPTVIEGLPWPEQSSSNFKL